MAQKYSCFQSLAGKLPSWKSPIMTPAEGAERSLHLYPALQVSSKFVKPAKSSWRCKAQQVQSSESLCTLIPSLHKADACRLRFYCRKWVYRILYRIPYSPSSSRDVTFFLIWRFEPCSLKVNTFVLPSLVYVRLSDICIFTRCITADPQGLDGD